jgi:hypothetical protein
VNNGRYSCLLSGLFSVGLFENTAVGFKWKDGHTPLVLDCVKGHECLWNTKSEHRRSNTASKNALRETARAEFSGTKYRERKIENQNNRYRVCR